MQPETNVLNLILAYLVILIGLWTWKPRKLQYPLPPGIIPWVLALAIVGVFHVNFLWHGLVVQDSDISGFPPVDDVVMLLFFVLAVYIPLLCILRIPWRGYWKLVMLISALLSVLIFLPTIWLGFSIIKVINAGVVALYYESSMDRKDLVFMVGLLNLVAAVYFALIVLSKLGQHYGSRGADRSPAPDQSLGSAGTEDSVSSRLSAAPENNTLSS